jgi:SOS-response transcriptional repressor LexA
MTRVGSTRLTILQRIMRPGLLPPTVRELMRLIDCTSPNAAHQHLNALRADGPIAYEPKLHGTIRPTCRFLTPEQLEDAPCPATP